MKKLLLSPCSLFFAAAFSAAFPQTALATVETVTYGNFEVYYFGNGDEASSWGTSSIDWTNEMKSGVERSLNYWNSVITTDSASKIKIACLWDATLGSRTLGGASSENYYNATTGVTLTATEAIWRDGISESEVAGSMWWGEYAVAVSLSTTANFYYGESATGIAYDQYDFQSMFTHEIGHAMGINSFCGSSGWKETIELSSGATSENVLQASTFDTLMVTKDESGKYNRVISESNEKTIFNTTKLEAAAYSTGTEYALALDEEGSLSDLRVYNPSGFEEGSSMSHFDFEDALMYANLTNGKIRRELLGDELLILSAMGWSVAIPEPSAFGLLAGTLALALCATRRKREKKLRS